MLSGFHAVLCKDGEEDLEEANVRAPLAPLARVAEPERTGSRRDDPSRAFTSSERSQFGG